MGPLFYAEPQLQKMAMEIQVMVVWVMTMGVYKVGHQHHEDGCSKVLQNAGILPYHYMHHNPQDHDLNSLRTAFSLSCILTIHLLCHMRSAYGNPHNIKFDNLFFLILMYNFVGIWIYKHTVHLKSYTTHKKHKVFKQDNDCGNTGGTNSENVYVLDQ
jgi:hypothetical protein